MHADTQTESEFSCTVPRAGLLINEGRKARRGGWSRSVNGTMIDSSRPVVFLGESPVYLHNVAIQRYRGLWSSRPSPNMWIRGTWMWSKVLSLLKELIKLWQNILEYYRSIFSRKIKKISWKTLLRLSDAEWFCWNIPFVHAGNGTYLKDRSEHFMNLWSL